MAVTKEALFLLVLLTASDQGRGGPAALTVDLFIVCNCSSFVRVTSGSAVGIDEVVSEAKEILHHHPFSVGKGSAGLGREVRQPYFPQEVNGAGVAMDIGR